MLKEKREVVPFEWTLPAQTFLYFCILNKHMHPDKFFTLLISTIFLLQAKNLSAQSISLFAAPVINKSFPTSFDNKDIITVKTDPGFEAGIEGKFFMDQNYLWRIRGFIGRQSGYLNSYPSNLGKESNLYFNYSKYFFGIEVSPANFNIQDKMDISLGVFLNSNYINRVTGEEKHFFISNPKKVVYPIQSNKGYVQNMNLGICAGYSLLLYSINKYKLYMDYDGQFTLSNEFGNPDGVKVLRNLIGLKISKELEKKKNDQEENGSHY